MLKLPDDIGKAVEEIMKSLDSTFGKRINLLLYAVDGETKVGHCASLGCPRCLLSALEDSMDSNNIQHDGQDATGVTH